MTYGFSFSWKRAVGISAAKGRLSRAIGVPLTRSGRERKRGRMVGGVVAWIVIGQSMASGAAAEPVSKFILGTWAFACTDYALQRKIVITENGKLTGGGEAGWDCTIAEMKERPIHFLDFGPSWEFRARCSLPKDGEIESGSLYGIVKGTFSLTFKSVETGKGRTKLTIHVDRPWQQGDGTGILALYPSTMYGPYDRCEQP